MIDKYFTYLASNCLNSINICENLIIRSLFLTIQYLTAVLKPEGAIPPIEWFLFIFNSTEIVDNYQLYLQLFTIKYILKSYVTKKK